jgi:hypothetical protein
MSHYVECKPGFKDREALIEALVAVGFDRSQIEVHEEGITLFGYRGDERAQRAHIVIRRQHVGPAANDVGWERLPDGTYRAWISEYDQRHRFNEALQNQVKQEYSVAVLSRQARALGRTVARRQRDDGAIDLRIGGYR